MCNPVAGGILRSVPKGGTTLCGHFLPEGVGFKVQIHCQMTARELANRRMQTHVLVNSTAMSLSEANFYHANEFLPERFLPERMRPVEFERDRRNNQKPFGLGPRSCLGRLCYTSVNDLGDTDTDDDYPFLRQIICIS